MYISCYINGVRFLTNKTNGDDEMTADENRVEVKRIFEDQGFSEAIAERAVSSMNDEELYDDEVIDLVLWEIIREA